MKVRFRFTKAGKIRFTSHRDVARIWERALRRAGILVAYSEGFSPRPKLAFGLALPTTYESLGEYIDVQMAEAADPIEAVPELDELVLRLNAALPEGISVEVAALVEPGSPSLQQAVTRCRWSIDVPGIDVDAITTWIDDVLGASSLVVKRERKGKEVTDDIRPLVHDISIDAVLDSGVRILADLGTQPRAVRPSELLAVLPPGLPEGLVRRTHQFIELDGAFVEPLTRDAVEAPHTLRCAS